MIANLISLAEGNLIDLDVMIRLFEVGLSQYTIVQVLMAADEFRGALDDYNRAADAVQAKLDSMDQYENVANYGLRLVYNCRSTEGYSALYEAMGTIADKVNVYCPVAHHKMKRFSSERFPVDKTLKDAAKLRNAAKKLNTLTTKA